MECRSNDRLWTHMQNRRIGIPEGTKALCIRGASMHSITFTFVNYASLHISIIFRNYVIISSLSLIFFYFIFLPSFHCYCIFCATYFLFFFCIYRLVFGDNNREFFVQFSAREQTWFNLLFIASRTKMTARVPFTAIPPTRASAVSYLRWRLADNGKS